MVKKGKKIMRIDGKCGKITKLIKTKTGKYNIYSVRIKLDKGKTIDIGVGFLSAKKDFWKLSSAQMKKITSKSFYGHKKGERVCISTEEPLYH